MHMVDEKIVAFGRPLPLKHFTPDMQLYLWIQQGVCILQS